LSYATGAIVVYSNCRANEPRHAIFLAGREISEIAGQGSSGFAQKRIADNVMLHTISLEAFRVEKHDLGNQHTELLDFLLSTPFHKFVHIS